MVIECPSCRTKFAVDDELVVGVANPRFHCSRCDHFFDGPQDQKSVPNETMSSTAPELEALETLPPADVSGSAGEEVLSDHSTLDIGHQAQLSLPLDYSGGNEEELLSPQLFLDDLEHEVESGDDASHLKGVVVAWPNGQHELAAETDLSAFSERAKGFHRRDGSQRRDDPAEAALRSRQPLPTTFAPPHSGMANEVPTATSSPLLICSPMILIALLISAFSAFTSKTMLGSKLSGSQFAAGSMRVPPAGVSIQRASGKMLALENGTRVFELRGTVINQSDAPVHNVTVQGKLFNESGQELRSVLAPVANRLMDTRAEALNAELLEELSQQQATPPPVQLAAGTASNGGKAALQTIAPGESFAFRLILSNLPPDASDFGVRVFSVAKQASHDLLVSLPGI